MLHARTLFLVLVLAATGSGTLGQVAAPPAAGRLVEHTVASAALKQNLLGDPAESRVVVYVPPGYDAAAGRRYPTLYLLHGYLGSERTFARMYPLEKMLDGLIERGLAREMIVVVPSGRNAYFGSFYVNSPVTGGWDDFVSKELVAWVDGQYRTLARAESRGIAGHSMGGFGAITLAMKHPDIFSAVYALSPCCVGLEGDIGPDNPTWPTTLKMRSRDELQPRPRSLEEFFPTAFIAIAAALSPNPAKAPLHVDLPFAEENGRIVPNRAAYDKWRAQMPLYNVERYLPSLQKLRGIYVDYGAIEEFTHIRSSTRAFSQELANRGIAHTFEVYAGGDHSNKIKERLETRVFRFFSDVLSFQ